MLKTKELVEYGKTNAYGCKEYHFVAKQNADHRSYMEDEVLVLDDFFQSHNKSILFAVFDGHGGDFVSKYLKNSLQSELQKALKTVKQVDQALQLACERITQQLRECPEARRCGSTATICLIHLEEAKRKLLVANLGDSSCYLFDDKGSERLTQEHRCDNEKEIQRIKKEGGKIINARIGGVLSVTRSVGDFELNQFGLSNQPAIRRHELRLSHRWVILGSDGLWDFTSLDDIQRVLRSESAAQDVAGALVKMAVANGSVDNISVIAIRL